MKNILFPSVRDLSFAPPIINAINYLATFEKVSVFSYFINENQFDSSVTLKRISKTPYPKTKFRRIIAKLKCWIIFYLFLFKNAKEFDYIWIGVWDYSLIMFVLRFSGFKGEVIYQLNELKFDQFEYCRKVDHVFVPDENRGWIAFFIGKFKKPPLVLPNIPFLPSSLSLSEVSEIDQIREKHSAPDVKIILYQGTIDYDKRCIKELLTAISKLPENFLLVIMPGNFSDTVIIERIKIDIESLKLAHRVYLIKSVKAPGHLVTVKKADIGIGLYRPISLNQVYAAPNRLYEFTKFDIPVILPDFPYFKYLGIKYPNAITTVNPESIDDIAAAILNVCKEPNYSNGRINAREFTNVEGNYKTVFDNCWNKIISKRK